MTERANIFGQRFLRCRSVRVVTRGRNLEAGGFGSWWLVGFVVLLLGRFHDAEGRVLRPPQMAYEPVRALPSKPKRLTGPDLVTAYDGEQVLVTDKDFEARDVLEDEFKDLERELGGS